MTSPAESFTDVVDLMEGTDDRYAQSQHLDIRDMFWSKDRTPFRVKVEGEDRLRRVLSVTPIKSTDGLELIVVEIEGSGPVVSSHERGCALTDEHDGECWAESGTDDD